MNRLFMFRYTLFMTIASLALTVVFVVKGGDFFLGFLCPIYAVNTIVQSRSCVTCYSELKLEERFGLLVDDIRNYGTLKRERRSGRK